MQSHRESLLQLVRLRESSNSDVKNHKNSMFDEKYFNDRIVDHAALAADVYYDQSPGSIRGWYRLTDTHGATATGYYGAVYINSAEDPSHAIIAHRGSRNLRALIADIAILRRKAFEQLDDADKFSAEVEDYLYKNFRKSIVTDGQWPREESRDEFEQRFMVSHTGHSLGAVLAEFCGINHYTCTFENPGSKEIWMDYINNISGISQETKQIVLNQILAAAKQNFLTIQSHVNMIDCCNSQIGSTFRMIDKPYKYDGLTKNELAWPFQISSSWVMNNFYVGPYTLYQHRIEPMLEYLYSGGRVIRDSSPAGFEEGYIEFLDTGKNRTFWEGYFRYMWEADNYKPKEPDFKIFLNRGIASVDAAYDRALRNKAGLCQSLPDNLKGSGPSIEEIAAELSTVPSV